MDYGGDLHEPRTNAEQSETGDDIRVSYGSRKRPQVKARAPFPFEQADAETFAWCRKKLSGSADAKYTYFMRDRVSGLIKIGMSADPFARRAALSASGARDMEILLTLRDGNLEFIYHRHFSDLRVEGEWFAPHPDIFAEINRLTAEV